MTSRLLYSFNDSTVCEIQSSNFEVCPPNVRSQILSWKGLLNFSDENPAILILPIPKNDELGRRFAADLRDLVFSRILNQEMSRATIKGSSGNGSRIFTRGDFGKPQIEGLSFNLSYTRGWFALAVSRSTPLGIDIESKDQLENRYKKNPRGLHAVVQHFFSVQEAQALDGISMGKDWIREFGRMWCYKEAVVKCHGLSFGSHGDLVSAINFPSITTLLVNESPDMVADNPNFHTPSPDLQTGNPGVGVQEIYHPDVYCFLAKG